MEQTTERYFGATKQELTTDLDQIVEETIKSNGAIRTRREDIAEFGWVTKDNNPAHKIPRIGRTLGFEDTPFMGAHVAAYAEKYAIDLISKIKQKPWASELKIISQGTSFKSALYPDEELNWQVTGYRLTKKDNDQLVLSLEGNTKRKDQQVKIAEVDITISHKYNGLPEIAIPIFWRKFPVKEEHLNVFYSCTGHKSAETFPHSLTAAYAPAAQLLLLEEKTGDMVGANLSMDFQVISPAELGPMMKVDIFRPSRPPSKRGNNYLYKLKTLCSQDDKMRMFGEMLVSTPYNLEF